jgi:hypothetical protein
LIAVAGDEDSGARRDDGEGSGSIVVSPDGTKVFATDVGQFDTTTLAYSA